MLERSTSSWWHRWTYGLFVVLLVTPSPLWAEEGDTGTSAASNESTSADELARRVVERTGDPHDVTTLAFTFVVEVEDEVRLRRRHVWRPGEGTVTVSTDGESVTLTELHEHDLSSLADDPGAHAETWQTVAPDASPERAAEAWSQFVNDSYWLLAPSKLLDPGVQRTLDEQGRLVLTFDGVGLTPDDTYRLTIDRETDRVTRWSYELQGGRTGAFEWSAYETFGPLLLSTRRVSEDDATVVRFDSIEVEAR